MSPRLRQLQALNRLVTERLTRGRLRTIDVAAMADCRGFPQLALW